MPQTFHITHAFHISHDYHTGTFEISHDMIITAHFTKPHFTKPYHTCIAHRFHHKKFTAMLTRFITQVATQITGDSIRDDSSEYIT
jgi:hypothetical protein